MRILIVDDNETLRDGMVQILAGQGYTVDQAPAVQQGLELLKIHGADLILTDQRMEGGTGMDLLREVKAIAPDTGVILITAYGTIDLAVEAMKAGAWDFLTKPFSKEALVLKVARYAELQANKLEAQRLQEENQFLREEMDGRLNYGEIVGESPGMRKIYETLEKVAPGDTSILILGESGTGKELIAKAVHRLSRRSQGPFIRVNCGALAEGILESELFGHEKGAFTGALRQKKGRFELAQGGTLFLDEIGDLGLGLQVKLLRVLQEREFERVGGEETLSVDVRVVAATHRNLPEAVREGRFREDLYYRLFIVPIHLPPLKERIEDIPLLARHFIGKLCEAMGRPPLNLTQAALDTLKAYAWPGNIRELSNVLERAVVLASGPAIDREDLVFMVESGQGTQIAKMGMDLDGRLAALEKRMLKDALRASGGVKARAARLLGIKTSALYYKMEKYGLITPGDMP